MSITFKEEVTIVTPTLGHFLVLSAFSSSSLPSGWDTWPWPNLFTLKEQKDITESFILTMGSGPQCRCKWLCGRGTEVDSGVDYGQGHLNNRSSIQACHQLRGTLKQIFRVSTYCGENSGELWGTILGGLCELGAGCLQHTLKDLLKATDQA